MFIINNIKSKIYILKRINFYNQIKFINTIADSPFNGNINNIRPSIIFIILLGQKIVIDSDEKQIPPKSVYDLLGIEIPPLDVLLENYISIRII